MPCRDVLSQLREAYPEIVPMGAGALAVATGADFQARQLMEEGLPFPALPNDIAFDEDGTAYVTDSLQATVWRVPAGGGTPQVWYQDARFTPDPVIGVGTNGIRLSPDRSKAFVTVTFDQAGQSFLYTLPLVAAPQPSDLLVFKAFGPTDLPDGIAFGKSGNLYVAIATPGLSGIVILDPSGTIRYLHRGKTLGDYPPLGEVLAALRAST